MTAPRPLDTPQRQLWNVYEPVHAICYFDPAFVATMAKTGLTGWWNGYFAGRAAPLGPAPAPVVTSLVFGFAPRMVARAVPKIWSRITPASAIEARLEAAGAVLAEHTDGGSTADLKRALDDLERIVETLCFDGRALASAWQSVPRQRPVLQRLWLASTVLREHRGDGHVIAATACGLTGLEASLTHVATGRVTRELIQGNRGWTDDEWETARHDLLERSILAPDGTLTTRGAALREQVEDLTDELASTTTRTLADATCTMDVLTRLARSLIDHGRVSDPNPIGVPRP